MHSEVHLLHAVQGCATCQHSGVEHAGPRIYRQRHTDDYWRVAARTVQLQLFASCSGCCHMHRVRARRTHSQVHLQLPLARPDTRENAGKQPLIC
jgi:hypothetical protein